MSRSLSRACSLSSASSFSSISDTNVDASGASDMQPLGSQSSESKRTRKRFSHDQLIVLEQAFHNSSHPTREDREDVARRAEMSMKSVTIWFQNKRQSERKVAQTKSISGKALQPLAMYPAQQSTSQYLSADPTSLLRAAPSYSSTSPSKSNSRLPHRTASGFLSLDRVASRSERAPHTPTKPVRHASFRARRSPSPEALWDSMLSSPPRPEPSVDSLDGPPTSPSTRDYLDFASARHGKSGNQPRRRTLEWACAAARLTVGKDDVDLDKAVSETGMSLSEAVLASNEMDEMAIVDADAKTEIIDAEMESIDSSHEAITPDSSQFIFAYQSSPTQKLPVKIKKETPEREETTEDMPSRANIGLERDTDTDIIDAAWALCGLSTLRG